MADRMPEYRYPKAVGTTYDNQQNMHNSVGAGWLGKGEVWNLELIPRAQGKYPHGNETLARDSFQPFPISVEPEEAKYPAADLAKPRAMNLTQTRAEFCDYGPRNVHYEKKPQYPYYSLPHQTNTLYQDSFRPQIQSKSRSKQKTLRRSASVRSTRSQAQVASSYRKT